MSFSYSNMSQGAKDAFDADKSMFLANNALASATDYRLVQGTGWGDDQGYFTLPESGIDGRPWYALEPITPGTDITYSYILGFDTPISIDIAAVQLTEIPTINGSCLFTFGVANDSSGSPGAFTDVYSLVWGAASVRTAFWFDLTWDHTIINSVDWVRFSWTHLDAAPKIGQVWAGRRTQFGSRPQLPYWPGSVFSLTEDGTIESGRPRTRRLLSSGFFNSNLRYLAQDYGDDYFDINLRSAAREVWTNSGYGRKPIVFWDNPGTALNVFNACHFSNAPDFSLQGPYHSDIVFGLQEMAPAEASE